ncbi:MAG: hypothetical protein FWC03_13245, partial [Treponema sp.]|nr:hypothetical protein [Treponema sp.]
MKYINRKRIIAFFALTAVACTLYAQTTFPAGDFWSLDAGIGMSNVLVDGHSFQLVIDPKLWLSPPLMVGSRLGVNYSSEADHHDILTFEGQVYIRWN